MQTKRCTLVTIIAEEVIEPQLTQLLLDHGATGFTVTPCRGKGPCGRRTRSMPGDNVRIEVVVDDISAEQIVEHLALRWFTNYAVIAWLLPIRVVRGGKYDAQFGLP